MSAVEIALTVLAGFSLVLTSLVLHWWGKTLDDQRRILGYWEVASVQWRLWEAEAKRLGWTEEGDA